MKTKLMLAAAVLAVFAAPARAEMSGVPPEIQFWLVQPTIPVAEASVRQLRMTTGEALPAAEAKVKQPRMTTGEGPDGRLRGGRELDYRSDFGPSGRSLLCIGRAGAPYLNERMVDRPKQRRTTNRLI